MASKSSNNSFMQNNKSQSDKQQPMIPFYPIRRKSSNLENDNNLENY